MCTVSFYKKKDTIIITSNRDEQVNRLNARSPKKYVYNGKKLWYPKDPQGKGTWFVADALQNVWVLLNGAAFKHIASPPYRKSRGLVLLDLASSNNLQEAWQCIDLIQIEPFTIVAYVNHQLLQLRWDGQTKKLENLSTKTHYIWSSTTLYEPEIIQKRILWFESFLKLFKYDLTAEDLLLFHKKTKYEDSENGVIINRQSILITKSITQYVLEKNSFYFLHIDLINHTQNILKKLLR